MIREIEFNNTTFQYDLQYRNVKNINFRVKPDGSIHVSANKSAPPKVIEEALISRMDYIVRVIEKYQNMPNDEKKQYFSESEVKELILRLCREVYPYYESLDIKYPEIKFRKMVSRWGSCHTKKYILTFNINLMYAPIECVEYVVHHEFTHFLQPNHSKLFYEELEKVYPNWKECRKKLRDINIR